jgi:hypothetical protein
VPAQCPSADDVTRAVAVALPHVNPVRDPDSGGLNCTYYGAAGPSGSVVNITFIPLPSGTTVASYTAQIASKEPSAVSVSGVGDAAFYFTTGAPSGLNFISGGTACNMYTANFAADKAQLVQLAESILQG